MRTAGCIFLALLVALGLLKGCWDIVDGVLNPREKASYTPSETLKELELGEKFDREGAQRVKEDGIYHLRKDGSLYLQHVNGDYIIGAGGHPHTVKRWRRGKLEGHPTVTRKHTQAQFSGNDYTTKVTATHGATSVSVDISPFSEEEPADRPGSEGDKAVIPAGVHVVNIPDGQVVKLRVAGRPFEIELPGEAEVTLLNNWGVEIGKPVVASAGVFSEENPSRVHAVQLNPVPEEDMEVRLTVKDE